jgi:chromosome segregation ATPase
MSCNDVAHYDGSCSCFEPVITSPKRARPLECCAALRARVAELERDLERTRQERDNCHSHFAALQKAHRERHDELNRLRAALEQITHDGLGAAVPGYLQNVARAALGDEGREA